MNNLKSSILKTIIYHDIFDYPLSFSQLWQFLISDKFVSKKILKDALIKYKNEIGYKKNLYFLKKRTHIVDKRLKKEIINRKKLKIAQKISSHLSKIPSIKFIGISGGLAMNSAEEVDDIDFFIITKKNTIWITRFLCLVILELLNVRRKRNSSKVSDKICLNMFVDEVFLLISKERQNLYTAHEVLQMKPLFQRGTVYKNFLFANIWVYKYMSNGIKGIKNQELKIRTENKSRFLIYFLYLLNPIAKKIQFIYMKNHISKEIVKDTMLAFHPIDYKTKTLSAYNKRIKQYGNI